MNESPDPASASAPARLWLALLSQAEVVGPLSDDELRACLADGQVPASAQLFRLQSGPDAPDRAAELASDNARLAESLRGAEAEARRLAADVKARDIEFEGERQQMAADVSKLRAESLRKDARIETLEKSAALLSAAETARTDAERRLGECEQRAADLAAEAAGAASARAEADALRSRANALQSALDAARDLLRDRSSRLADLVRSLSEFAAEPVDIPDAPAPKAATAPVPPAGRKTVVRPLASTTPSEEVIEPIVERPSAGDSAGTPPDSGAHAGNSRLAQLEARAREELAMLQSHGRSAPRWARRKA